MFKGVLALLRNSNEMMQLCSTSQFSKHFDKQHSIATTLQNRNFKDYQHFTKKETVAQRK